MNCSKAFPGFGGVIPSEAVVQAERGISGELEGFAKGNRADNIDTPMRTMASLMTEDEKQAVAAYYGAGLGNLPVGASAPAK